jgi:hypothetical protein
MSLYALHPLTMPVCFFEIVSVTILFERPIQFHFIPPLLLLKGSLNFDMGVAKLETPPNLMAASTAKVYVVKSVLTNGDRNLCNELCKKIFTAMNL